MPPYLSTSYKVGRQRNTCRHLTMVSHPASQPANLTVKTRVNCYLHAMPYPFISPLTKTRRTYTATVKTSTIVSVCLHASQYPPQDHGVFHTYHTKTRSSVRPPPSVVCA